MYFHRAQRLPDFGDALKHGRLPVLGDETGDSPCPARAYKLVAPVLRTTLRPTHEARYSAFGGTPRHACVV